MDIFAATFDIIIPLRQPSMICLSLLHSPFNNLLTKLNKKSKNLLMGTVFII